jgi:glycosidase
MPFNEFEGNESWGYNPSFYFAPDKYYGPKNDLKSFIDACHERGIAVIQDMVLNHSYSQSPLVQMYMEGGAAAADNPLYNVVSPNQAYSWGYDFDHESQATKDFVDRVNEYWLTEYNVDGFRFDFTKGMTNTPGEGWAYDAARIAILKRMADHIWSVNPDAYVILEHFTDNSEEKVLADYGMMVWGRMDGPYRNAADGNHGGNASDLSWISYKARGFNHPHVVGYMESHDEERIMYWLQNYASNPWNTSSAMSRIKAAAALFFPIPGPKMVWQFGELGYDFSIDLNGRVGNKPIRWDYYDETERAQLHDIFSALIKLKTDEPAFSTTDFTLDVGGPVKKIGLNHNDMDVRIVGNFDLETLEVGPNFSQTGTWYNYFAGTSLEVTDVGQTIWLGPGQFRIFTTKQLEKPEITNVEEAVTQPDDHMHIYPVPAQDALFVNAPGIISSVRIYSLNGKVLYQQTLNSGSAELPVGHLDGGVYILRTDFPDRPPVFEKFIKE